MAAREVTAPAAFDAPEPPERVLFRERRRPPLLAITLVPAAVVATLAVDAETEVRAALALAAALLVAAGVQLRRRVFIEDFVLSDRRVVVSPRRAAARWLALDEVERVDERGLAVRFCAGGETLSFGYVRDLEALRSALVAVRPDLDVHADDRPGCRTCGIRF